MPGGTNGSNALDYSLDHVIVFVDDLLVAEHAFSDHLGLQVTSHAEHPGFGTRNAAIAFDLGFIELLTERDPGELRSTRYGRLFLDRHARQGNGAAVFVLRTVSFERVISNCRDRGGLCEDRLIGFSKLVGGEPREWEAAFMPGTEPVYLDPRLPVLARPSPWPRKTPGVHPLGANRLEGIVIAVEDLDEAVELYRVQLGLEAPQTKDHPQAKVAQFSLPTSQQIVLAQPLTSQGALAARISSVGDGIFAVMLRIADADLGMALWKRLRIKTAIHDWFGQYPISDPIRGMGTRLALISL